MALVGHISGSGQSQSVIGVTGSVVFANQPQAAFPSITSVGSDVVFFVSGTVGGKNVAGQKTVAVFGGDTVVSGSLTVGSGSVKITSNDIQFSGLGNRIQLDGSDLKFFDASNPSGFTLSSLGSGGGATGADPGASYIVVSTTASLPNERALTGGTGILTTDGGADGNFTLAINDSVVATVSGTNFTGGVTGTSLSMTGDITGSSLRLTGGELTTAQTTFSLLNSTATTVSFGGAATSINVGNAAGVVDVAGALRAGGGYDNTGVTLSGAGNVRANGFLQVDGAAWLTGSVTLAGNAQTITHTGTGDLTISSTGGSVVVEGVTFTGNNVTIPGDLTVSGQVVAIDTTNLRVEDAVILLASGTATTANSKSIIAFASGSAIAGSALTFGPVGSGNALAVGVQDVFDGTLNQASISFSQLGAFRATEYQVSVDTAAVKGSGGQITVSGSAVNLHGSTANGVTFIKDGGTTFAKIDNITGDPTFRGVGTTWFSGSNVWVTSNNGDIKIAKGTNSALELNTDGATVGAIYAKTPGPANSPQALILSGSSVALGASTTTSGVVFALGGSSTARLSGASATSFDLKAIAGNATFTLGTGGGTTDALVVSGSEIKAVAGANGLKIFRDSTTTAFAQISSNGTVASFSIDPSLSAADVVNTSATTVNFAGAATTLTIGATTGLTTIRNGASLAGNTVVGADSSKTLEIKALITGSLLPNQDMQYNLGSPTLRWANMYTGDLHLRNERGDWTIIEEPDFLTITNNRNGKRYKFVLEEIG